MFKSYVGKLKRGIYNFLNCGISCNYNKFLSGGGTIGTGCVVFPDVEFGSEPYLISIGDNCRITNGVRFVTHDGGVWVLRNLGLKDVDVFGQISIGNNVHIGWNAIIMPNVHIGNNCVIGAGAVVTKDIPDNSVAVGVPARVIESIEEYENKVTQKCDYTKQLTYEEKKKYLLKKFNIEKSTNSVAK